MMKAIEQLVFNELAARKGVNLPGVGALLPEFRPARLKNRSMLETPSAHVVFSHNESPAWPALPVLMARMGAMDEESAQAEYNRWLQDARKEKRVAIHGVGEIRQGHFSPSPELQALLNPERPSRIRLRRRRKPLRLAMILLALLALCLAVMIWMRNDTFRLFYRPAKPPVEVALLQDSCAADHPADTVQMTEPVENPAPSGASHHLIIGSFSTSKNADTFIADAKRKNPHLALQKISMSNDKFRVSIFSSNDLAAVERRQAELKASYPDCWVYTQSDQ